MEFGYFTLSDNHYPNNPRTANQYVADITAEAIYADEIGMHSAWIGEHHFNSLGILSCPDIVLGYIAAQTEPYIVAQLQAFKSGTRKNEAMSMVAPSLSDTDIEDLAAYFSAIEIKIIKLPLE